MGTKVKPSPERIREVLRYDPITGVISRDGVIAGTLASDGYIKICVDYVITSVNVLAWVIMTGQWPDHIVEHENRIKSDNRWCNLRPASPCQNMYNMGLSSMNTSGYKGVSFHKGHAKWIASIRVNRRRKHLGYFQSAEAAKAAYDAASLQHHAEFSCLG